MRGPRFTARQPCVRGERYLLVGEPAFGPHGDADRRLPIVLLRRGGGTVRIIRMSQYTEFSRIAAGYVFSPIDHVGDAHQHIAAALLARLDDVAFHLVAFAFARIDRGALARKRNECRDAEFGQLLDEKLAAVPFRQRRGDLQRERQLALRLVDADDLQRDLAAGDRSDARGVFVAVAVEEADFVAGAESAHRGKMVNFRAVQSERAGTQRQIDVKSLRHLWYNTAEQEELLARGLTRRDGSHVE